MPRPIKNRGLVLVIVMLLLVLLNLFVMATMDIVGMEAKMTAIFVQWLDNDYHKR